MAGSYGCLGALLLFCGGVRLLIPVCIHFLLSVVRVWLNNAATSWILVNAAVMLILSTTASVYFYLICVNVSFILNRFFYNTVLSDKKVCLFN